MKAIFILNLLYSRLSKTLTQVQIFLDEDKEFFETDREGQWKHYLDGIAVNSPGT
jgi:hypothetical protein